MSDSPRTFGITSTLSGLADGLIANSISFNKSVETAEARNVSGEIIDIAAYSKSTEITVDGLFVGSGVEPGTTISIGGNDYLVTTSTKTESNTDFQQGSVTARTADKATFHTLTSPSSGI